MAQGMNLKKLWLLLTDSKFKKPFNMCLAISLDILFVYGLSILPFGVKWFAERDKYVHDFIIHHLYANFWWLLSVWGLLSNLFLINLYYIVDILQNYSVKYPKFLPVKEKIETLAGYMIFTLNFPINMVVVFLFWYLRILNREKMFPSKLDEFFAPWMNHVVHSAPVILLVLVMAISNRFVPVKKHSLNGVTAIMAVYLIGTAYIRVTSGKWVYIALEFLTLSQFVFVVAICIIGPIVNVHLAYYINDRLQESKENALGTQKKAKAY